MRETGMEIAGATAARNERRNAKMIRMTMTFASRRLVMTSLHRFTDERRIVRRDRDLDAFRQRLAQFVHRGADAV